MTPQGMPAELPRELRRFLRLVEEQRYWESHEALEGPWRDSGSDFYHGLILYASAFVHLQRRNAHGLRSQLEKARRKLEPFRPFYLGLDVDRILSHAEQCRRSLAPDASSATWQEVQEPWLQADPGRIRGDEPELRGERGGR